MKRVERDNDVPSISKFLIQWFKETATLDQKKQLARTPNSEKLEYIRYIVELSDWEIFPAEMILEIFKYFTTVELQAICSQNSFFSSLCKRFDLIRREFNKGRLFFPMNVQLPRLYRRALSVACGDEFTVVLMDDGLAYSCGENTRGQLGREPGEGQYDWHLIPIPGANNIKAVACGSQHTLLLDKAGSIYTCGLGHMGSLGDGMEDRHTRSFIRRVPCARPIVAICSSHHHNLLLDANGEVHVFGNNIHFQLGVGGGIQRVLIPTKIMDQTFPEPITAISSGEQCSLFLVGRSGNLYGCGTDIYGMLGLGLGRYLRPVQIPNLPGPVAQISCGTFHSMILLRNGGLYAAGQGFDGQLSTGDVILYRRTFEPMIMMDADDAVSTIIAQRNLSFIILKNGRLFSCGNGVRSFEFIRNSIVDIAMANDYIAAIYYAANR
jgi:alpha-tubulin suppressor-like RCC1 family protein